MVPDSLRSSLCSLFSCAGIRPRWPPPATKHSPSSSGTTVPKSPTTITTSLLPLSPAPSSAPAPLLCLTSDIWTCPLPRCASLWHACLPHPHFTILRGCHFTSCITFKELLMIQHQIWLVNKKQKQISSSFLFLPNDNRCIWQNSPSYQRRWACDLWLLCPCWNNDFAEVTFPSWRHVIIL